MIRALIFDIGNVLVRTLDWSKRQAWESKLKLAPNTLEQRIHGTVLNSSYERGELSTSEFWLRVGHTLGIEGESLAQLRVDFYDGDKLNEELMVFIRGQRDAGLLTGIISNAPPMMRVTLRDQFHILHYFDAITISGEAGVRKPSPGIYHLCCAELGIAPAEGIFVDDLDENCAGASAVGLNPVHFRDTAVAIGQIRNLIAANAV